MAGESAVRDNAQAVFDWLRAKFGKEVSPKD